MSRARKIMTNYGLYGTILSIDEDTNMALHRVHTWHRAQDSPSDDPQGGRARRRRRAATPTAEAADSEPEVLDAEPAVEPEFGERADAAGTEAGPQVRRQEDARVTH